MSPLDSLGPRDSSLEGRLVGEASNLLGHAKNAITANGGPIPRWQRVQRRRCCYMVLFERRRC
jgi:hypothetical protein